MADDELAQLCAMCRRLFDNWRKMLKLGLENFSTYYDFLDIEKSEAEGCGLCAAIITEIPTTTLRSLKSGQYIRSLQVTLSGKRYEWGKSNTITLSISCGPFEKVQVEMYHNTELVLEVMSEQIPSRTDAPEVLRQAVEWFRKCTQDHSKCNRHAMQSQHTAQGLPSRLIHITQSSAKLLLTGNLPSNTKYATLSHCWGKLDFYKLTRENIHSMHESIPIQRLSRTFQDAISVTRRFGLEYLWIDSICIIQDDQEDWLHESALMANVYGGSTLNIAASHAEDGSVGCFVDRNQKRVVPCFVTLYGEEYRCVPASLYSRGVNDNALSGRAWAFQERFLAPRTLFFGRSQIFWECWENPACESFPMGIPYSLEIDGSVFVHDDGRLGRNNMDSGHSYPGAWSDIILAYSSGKLTHETDKLLAISGVARWMHQFSKDQYLAGLWRTNLEWQLLWSVRLESIGEGNSRLAMSSLQYIAPSWSWASKKGTIRQQFSWLDEKETSKYELFIYALSASVDTTLQGDTFGQVTGGYIVLSCLGLLPLELALRSENFGEKVDIEYGEPGCRRKNQASLLWDNDNTSLKGTWLLPVWARNPTMLKKDDLPKKMWGGLILRRLHDVTFQRVGRADMYRDLESHMVISSAKDYAQGNFDKSAFVKDPRRLKGVSQNSSRRWEVDITLV